MHYGLAGDEQGFIFCIISMHGLSDLDHSYQWYSQTRVRDPTNCSLYPTSGPDNVIRWFLEWSLVLSLTESSAEEWYLCPQTYDQDTTNACFYQVLIVLETYCFGFRVQICRLEASMHVNLGFSKREPAF